MRVSVFDCKNIPTMDIEGTSDVYIKGFIDEKAKKQTDCHYRCMTGNPSFSWRMLFDVDLPRSEEEQVLVLQAWDRDFVKSNEFICEWTLNLAPLLKMCQLSNKPVILNQRFHDSF